MSSGYQNGNKHGHAVDQLKQKREIDWPMVLFLIHVNVLGILSFGVLLDGSLLTIMFTMLLIFLGILGMTAGAHRLWAHRSYEANLGVRVFLMLCQTLAGQGTIYDWVVKHRVHHKYFETEDDPFQTHKGFWTAHMLGMCYKTTKRDAMLIKQVDTQDLENDAVVAFQKKFYWLLLPIISILLPINAPLEYWNDSVVAAVFITGFIRYAITCHFSWLIYSAIHIWGLKPDDKYPADTMLVFILTKSHWLKYHYILPWDYQVGEYGDYGDGYISSIIRGFAAFGWASELRSVSSETIQEAVYNSTISGKSVEDCVQEITTKTKTRASAQGQFHSAKFL